MGIPLGKKARDAVETVKVAAEKTSNSIMLVGAIALVALVLAVVAIFRSK